MAADEFRPTPPTTPPNGAMRGGAPPAPPANPSPTSRASLMHPGSLGPLVVGGTPRPGLDGTLSEPVVRRHRQSRQSGFQNLPAARTTTVSGQLFDPKDPGAGLMGRRTPNGGGLQRHCSLPAVSGTRGGNLPRWMQGGSALNSGSLHGWQSKNKPISPSGRLEIARLPLTREEAEWAASVSASGWQTPTRLGTASGTRPLVELQPLDIAPALARKLEAAEAREEQRRLISKDMARSGTMTPPDHEFRRTSSVGSKDISSRKGTKEQGGENDAEEAATALLVSMPRLPMSKAQVAAQKPDCWKLERDTGVPRIVIQQAGEIWKAHVQVPAAMPEDQPQLDIFVDVGMCRSVFDDLMHNWSSPGRSASGGSVSHAEVSFRDFVIYFHSRGFAEDMVLSESARDVRDLARRHGLSYADAEAYKHAFDVFDEDHSGEIEYIEFEKILATIMRTPVGYEMPQSRILHFWKQADMDGNGSIDFEEFIVFYRKYFIDSADGSCPFEELYTKIRPECCV